MSAPDRLVIVIEELKAKGHKLSRRSGSEYLMPCPGHSDADAESLSIRTGPGNAVELACREGCSSSAEIARMLGITDELEQSAEAAPRTMPASRQVPDKPKPAPPAQSAPVEIFPVVTLDELVATFRRWLYLPDISPLLALLGTVAANLAPGDPVWLLLVAPPGGGKTEMLESLRKLPSLHHAATLTEASLLSGTSKKDRAQGASGGLLRLIGARGILVNKDFGSVLSMHRDARASVMAALREVYDGHWVRHVGTDGGQKLEWAGHVGFVAGVPPVIDRHHGVMSSLGERFMLLRMTDVSSTAQTRLALRHAGKEGRVRRELQAAVAGLFAGIVIPEEPVEITDAEEDRLIATASLTARCRSSVERDGYSRDIELVGGEESPGRLGKTLKRIFGGLVAIGVERAEAWSIVNRIALDCIPAIRRKALEAVNRLSVDGAVETKVVAAEIGYPTRTAHRALEDMACYSVVKRISGGEGKSDRWDVHPHTRPLIPTATDLSGCAQSRTGQNEHIPPSLITDTTFDDKSVAVGQADFLAMIDGRLAPKVAAPVTESQLVKFFDAEILRRQP